MSYRIWIYLFTSVASAVLALTFPVRYDRMWVDPVSGSLKLQTSSFYFPSPARVQQSELERWIIAHEGFHDSEWQFVNETYRMLSGRRAGCGAGRTPRIFHLYLGDHGLKNFVRNATDEEIAEFVRVMRHGTRIEQEQAVEKAGTILERAYSNLAATARTGAVGVQSPATASGNDAAGEDLLGSAW